MADLTIVNITPSVDTERLEFVPRRYQVKPVRPQRRCLLVSYDGIPLC